MPSKPVGVTAPAVTSREIQVTLLLTGGHEHRIYLPEDSPTFQQLFAALVSQTQATTAAQGLFQIPINNQRSLLAFPSQHLVGIITEPPLSVQFQSSDGNHGTSTIAPPATVPPTIPPPIPESIPQRYIQITDFLDRSRHQELLDYALNSAAEFVETGPVTNTELYKDYRRSQVIFYPQKVDAIVEKIQSIMPKILSDLDMEAFAVTNIETQVTVHNDNNYYKIHNDNGSPETANRKLTYVYYFYQEPKAFQGGELTIYDTTNAFTITAATPRQLIQPRNNSIVFFPSQFMHEVLPVQCRSQKFADSRFTVNGWIRG
jgi:SM-20-related protein